MQFYNLFTWKFFRAKMILAMIYDETNAVTAVTAQMIMAMGLLRSGIVMFSLITTEMPSISCPTS